METEFERPKFLVSYFEIMGAQIKRRGLRAIMPYWLALCLGAGWAAAHYMPVAFWTQVQWVGVGCGIRDALDGQRHNSSDQLERIFPHT